jgi:protein tyrosine phosphatase (PTP) superfamily phosphohydrolase (DUF442 family)
MGSKDRSAEETAMARSKGVRRFDVTRTPHALGTLALAAALFAAPGCGSESASTAKSGAAETAATAEMPATAAPAPAAVEIPAKPTLDDHGHPVGLHEYNPFTDEITSGGQPDGEEAFRNLAALGYTTIVSVDGARPDLELAKKYGLRYVHVPVQYSGTKPDEIAQIAKAIETSKGGVYVHCHHGKHRGPGALSATCVAMGILTVEQALAEMKVSGTDPKYKGLFRDVMNAQPISAAQRAALPAELPEYVKPGDLAESMVGVDLRWDHLKASKEAKWGVPPASPDVDPPHEARMLWEHYAEIARLDDAKSRGADFMKFLADSEAGAKSLEDALRANDAKASDAAFDAVKKSCAACHAKFRDN